MPISTIDIRTGTLLFRANFFLHDNNEIEFLEVFEEYIMLKQQNHRLVIYSVWTTGSFIVDGKEWDS